MARRYNYQIRNSTSNQNNTTKIIKTREFTIKKIKVIEDSDPKEIQLTFNGGTRHTIKSDDKEYLYDNIEFELMSKCLAAGDKALCSYNQATSRIERCNIEFVQLYCNVCGRDTDDKGNMVLFLQSQDKEIRFTVDSSVRCFKDDFWDEEVTVEEFQAIFNMIIVKSVEVVYISGKEAAICVV